MNNELPQEPPTAQTGQTQIHPTAEEWQELRGILWGMGELLGTQAIVLEELSRRLPTLPYSEQTRDAARDLAAIRKLLEQERQRQEQAGKKSGRRFSPESIWAGGCPGQWALSGCSAPSLRRSG